MLATIMQRQRLSRAIETLITGHSRNQIMPKYAFNWLRLPVRSAGQRGFLVRAEKLDPENTFVHEQIALLPIDVIEGSASKVQQWQRRRRHGRQTDPAARGSSDCPDQSRRTSAARPTCCRSNRSGYRYAVFLSKGYHAGESGSTAKKRFVIQQLMPTPPAASAFSTMAIV